MSTLNPESPCVASIEPSENGGMIVRLHVPTYSGGITFTLDAQRDADGDWRVFLPWPDEWMEPVTLPGNVEVSNGIAYLGAPDGPVIADYRDAGSA